MADEYTGTYTAPKRPLHPNGSFAGVCVDFLNLGTRRRDPKKGGKPYLVPSVAYVFYCGENDPDTGFPLYLMREFDVRLGEGTMFREFLEGWRNAKFTAHELENGIQFHKAVGKPGMVTVIHNTPKERTYANIESVKPLAKGMFAPTVPDDYKRPDFWDKTKQKYAEETAAFNRQFGTPEAQEQQNDDDVPW